MRTGERLPRRGLRATWPVAAWSVALVLALMTGCSATRSAPGATTPPPGSQGATVTSSSPPVATAPSTSAAPGQTDALTAALPDLDALGEPWALDGPDLRTATTTSVSGCGVLAIETAGRVAGVSRGFVSGEGTSAIRAVVYAGVYDPVRVQALVAALATCPAQRLGAQGAKAAGDVTRCASTRPARCFTVREVGSRLVGAQVTGAIPLAQLAAGAKRLADLTVGRLAP